MTTSVTVPLSSVLFVQPKPDDWVYRIIPEGVEWLRSHVGKHGTDWFHHATADNTGVQFVFPNPDTIRSAILFKLTWGGRASYRD